MRSGNKCGAQPVFGVVKQIWNNSGTT